MFRRSMVFAALVGLLALMAGPAVADLDLGVPTGTPLDWDEDLHKPIPTGIMGKKGMEVKKFEGKGEGTQIKSAVPPPVGYASVNLYNFFRVKTHDIMTHFKVNLPEKKEVPPNPPPPQQIATGERGLKEAKRNVPKDLPKRFDHGIDYKYIPDYPGELVWIGIATALRSQLHPEALSFPESLAYMIEIGEPTLVAPASIQTPLGDRVKQLVTEPPASAPPFPKCANPVDTMCARIAVLELCSGFPYGMDPRYAKRTLLLGDLAYEGVLACAKSGHSFLQRNAVAVLANFPGSEKVSADLAKIIDSTQDPVVKIRGLAGIARKKDWRMKDKLLSLAGGGEDYIRAMAIYALGRICGPKDVKYAKALAGMASGANRDMLWTILPAIARMGCKDPKVQSQVSSLWQSLAGQAAGIAEYKPNPVQEGAGGQFIPPNPEPKGYKLKILADFALCAAAASGNPSAITELHARGSAGIKAFTDAAKILAASIIPLTGTRGLEIAKAIATSQTPSSNDPTRAAGVDPNIAVAAVRAMGRADPTDLEWIKQTALGSGSPLVRAAALTALYRVSHFHLKEVCWKILDSASVGSTEEAFMLGMAIQMLDRINANKGEQLLKIAQAASGSGMWASRTATDEYDITKAKIDVRPPLWEVATLALGKTGYEGAAPSLINWVKQSKVRGEAALALGGCAGTKVQEVVATLLDTLIDPKDGWVRFCSYLSLKHISKQDFYTDYIFGSASSIYACRNMYKAWFEKNGFGDYLKKAQDGFRAEKKEEKKD